MKNAGKARSYGLYRHLRTSKEIIENLLNYSDKYINSILKNIGFKLVDNRYYHVFSSLYNHFADDENKSGKIAKLDKIAATFVKKYLAHNRIMTCYKE